eukprot:14712177-Alexandrium_andersonii.AAC.1
MAHDVLIDIFRLAITHFTADPDYMEFVNGDGQDLNFCGSAVPPHCLWRCSVELVRGQLELSGITCRLGRITHGVMLSPGTQKAHACVDGRQVRDVA